MEGGVTEPTVTQPDWGELMLVGAEAALAAAHWATIAGQLEAEGRMTPVAAHQVERLVIARVLHARAARRVLGGEALLEETPNGAQQQVPMLSVMNKQAQLAAQIEGELLLTPRKRATSGLEAPTKAERAAPAKLYAI